MSHGVEDSERANDSQSLTESGGHLLVMFPTGDLKGKLGD